MDKVIICNMALARIGHDAIELIDEPSEDARLCRRFYDQVRKATLRRWPWTFALRRSQLALVATDPPEALEWRYKYRYPASCLNLKRLYNKTFTNIPQYTEYKLSSDPEGRLIYCNLPNIWAEYVYDIQDCALMDDEFIEALSWKLAADIAFKLTGNMGLTQSCLQAYNALFAEAGADDMNEQNVSDPGIYNLAAARFTGLDDCIGG